MTDRLAARPPAPSVSVRRARPEDWEVHRAVRLAMLLDTPLAYGTTFAREVPMSGEQWRERMQHSASWLAFDGELPLGSVTLFHAPDQQPGEAHLTAMWVAGHARGSGVADALVAALIESAGSCGVHRLVLDVADGNERARRFYERWGFTPTGRTGALPHQPELTEAEMALALREPAAPPG